MAIMTHGAENVMVVCRCRPFSEKEKAAGHFKICNIDPKNCVISLKKSKTRKRHQNTEVYSETAQVIVDAALEGFNGTVLVYGQTGTGKTFSMQGIPTTPHLRGIIPKTFHHIFDHIAQTSQKTSRNGIYVKDLSAFVVKSVEEMEHLMDVGNKHRSVGATLMNENSSRSHSIFSITIESSEPGPDGQDRYVSGKLNLVDLAGSERQSKTGASGDRLKEATKINLSLSALGNCISALVDGRSSHSLSRF
ncbi:hypothetical protein BSLG_005656 [Batrachochytrium salamandrivorans]|nr:hypothetical protein BSLG_005656 [Batrachochytrium salamandrivorans]